MPKEKKPSPAAQGDTIIALLRDIRESLSIPVPEPQPEIVSISPSFSGDSEGDSAEDDMVVLGSDAEERVKSLAEDLIAAVNMVDERVDGIEEGVADLEDLTGKDLTLLIGEIETANRKVSGLEAKVETLTSRIDAAEHAKAVQDEEDELRAIEEEINLRRLEFEKLQSNYLATRERELYLITHPFRNLFNFRKQLSAWLRG